MGEESAANWGFREIASWIINLGQPIIYAAMLLGLPSVLLYCSQCWIIFRHRQFHNAFYLLFMSRAFLDMFLLLGSYINFRLPGIAGSMLLPLYKLLPNWFFVIMWVSNPYGIMGSSLTTTFMLLNRLSSILYPFSHEKIWRKSFPFVLFICLAIPLYFFRYFFGMQCFINVYHDKIGNFGISTNATMVIFFEYDALVNFISSLFFLFFCLLINVAIFVAYKWHKQKLFGNSKRKRMIQNGGAGSMANWCDNGGNNSVGVEDSQRQRERQRTEKKLLVYAVCTFASHMLHTLLMIGFFLAYQRNEMLIVGGLLCLTPLVYDMGSILIPAWLLLWASTDFRHQWCRQFMPRKWPLMRRFKRIMPSKNTITRVNVVGRQQQQRKSTPAVLWAQRM